LLAVVSGVRNGDPGVGEVTRRSGSNRLNGLDEPHDGGFAPSRRSVHPGRCGGARAAAWFATAASLCTAGLVTYGLIGFHLGPARIVRTAAVRLLYGAAMAAASTSPRASSTSARTPRS
jgi:hypothetical protein